MKNHCSLGQVQIFRPSAALRHLPAASPAPRAPRGPRPSGRAAARPRAHWDRRWARRASGGERPRFLGRCMDALGVRTKEKRLMAEF